MTPEFYEKLNDKQFAQKYYDEQLELAKAMLFEITSVTMGVNELNEGHDQEWANSYLLHLFEIVTIKHENFYVPDFISELQNYLFTLSMDRDDAYRAWEKKRFNYLGRDENGERVEKEPEAQTLDLSNYAENLDITSEQFSEIINNKNLPKEFQTILDTYCEVKQ